MPAILQRKSLDYIADQYVKFGGPPADVSPPSPLSDMCSSCPLYTAGRGDMVSYSGDLVSWPSGGSAPVALESALLEAGRLWLQDWKARFIAELLARGMPRLSPARGRRGLLGVFVVAKRSGQQRLVFDTRISNARFKPPPCAELPSGGARGDAGQRRRLAVLLMGCSWALHLCRRVSEASLARARIAPEQQVRDRSLGVRLGPRRPAAGAAYVDNYLVSGRQRAEVQAAAGKVEQEPSSLGFVVHEQVDATRHASFVGLDLDGREHAARVSAKRVWRLRCAIQELLLRPWARGAIAVGHCRPCSSSAARALRAADAAAALRDPGRLPSDEAKNWDKSFGEVDPNLLVGDAWAASGSGILMAPVPAAAAARQREALWGSPMMGLTCLEQRSVGKLHLDWSERQQLDSIVVVYFDYLYFQGHSGDDASRLLAALKFFLPPIGRWGDQVLCRAPRTLAGWGKCAPRRMRMPLPCLPVAALAGHAIAMILSFACYLRPSEADLLTAMQIAPPVGAAAGGSGLSALLLHPGELGRPGKTGPWDFTIVLDTFAFFTPALLSLKRRAGSPTVRHRSFPPGSLGTCMKEAVCALGLNDFPAPAHGLRHGGASDDLLSKRRQVLEVQQRGGWASDRNFKRCAKQARIIAELQRLGPRIIACGQAMDAALSDIFLTGRAVPVPSLTLREQ
ncbi:unnamed protein product [Prorocentrum cordatum]|uniref:DNA-directed DNA polymerase n=1 Tax=Prorocentrum cordatum TaxID=2364126 RepID=A0ABN9TK46_9DINO|nr:unnamed protein product [Polarella glacialis]